MDAFPAEMGAFPIQPFVDSAAIAGDAEALRDRAADSGYLYFSDHLEADVILDLRGQVAAICRGLGWLVDNRPAAEAIVRPSISSSPPYSSSSPISSSGTWSGASTGFGATERAELR